MIWEWRSCSIVMLTELEERGQVRGGRAEFRAEMDELPAFTSPDPHPIILLAGEVHSVLAH